MKKNKETTKRLIIRICTIGAPVAAAVVVASFFMYFIIGYFYSAQKAGIYFLANASAYQKVLISLSLAISIAIIAFALLRFVIKKINTKSFNDIFAIIGIGFAAIATLLLIEFMREIAYINSQGSLDMTTKHSGLGLWLNLIGSVAVAVFVIIGAVRLKNRIRQIANTPAMTNKKCFIFFNFAV